jgi:hypothetical protein
MHRKRSLDTAPTTMSKAPRRITRISTVLAILCGLLTAAFLWNAGLPPIVEGAIGLSVAVACGLFVTFWRFWGKLWFWALFSLFLVVHATLWWFIVRVEHGFPGVALFGAVGEFALLTVIEGQLRRRTKPQAPFSPPHSQ